MTVKPCRHLSSLSLGKLTDKLEFTSPLNLNSCAASSACNSKTDDTFYTCLTCLESFCLKEHHAVQHSRTRNHPLFYTKAGTESNVITVTVEDAFFCALCGTSPRIREPGKKERTSLEKIVGLFQINQKNAVDTVSFSSIDKNPPIHDHQVHLNSPVPKGIINLGNTCFMNSALQLLAATLYRHGPLKCSSSTSAIWNSLTYHLEEIYSSQDKKHGKKKSGGDSSSINPREFLNFLCGKQKKFASMQQQDTHDFLRLLFNSIPEQSKDSISPQSELFGGKFVSRVVCDRCRRVSDMTEPFLDISLSLSSEKDKKDFNTLEDSLSNLSISSSDADDIFNLIRNWNKKIVLEGENGYFCESCSPKDSDSLQKATLQFSFTESLPQFLILHLQRFKTSIRAGKKKSGLMVMEIEKDDRSISFPLDLTIPTDCFLSATPPESYSYQLYGYIIHEGSSTSSGHYTAVVSPCSKSDRWYYISDTRVKEIPKSKALDGESYIPYLLFYQKVNNSTE